MEEKQAISEWVEGNFFLLVSCSNENILMEWLNYHHLFYFWLTVKTGTVSAAAESLHLARPTVAAQIKELEKSVGQKLFEKQGRGLVLTEFGQQVHQYAEEIFAHRPRADENSSKPATKGNRKRFVVGLPDVVPKHIAFELLKPALHMADRPRTVCYEGKLNQLLADLALINWIWSSPILPPRPPWNSRSTLTSWGNAACPCWRPLRWPKNTKRLSQIANRCPLPASNRSYGGPTLA